MGIGNPKKEYSPHSQLDTMAFVSQRPFIALALFLTASSLTMLAADPPDTLTTSDGEKLTGHFVKAGGANVTFHSDTVGDVTVPWAKIKELTTSGKYAIIPKGFVFKRGEADGRIQQGTLSVADSKLTVNPGNGAAPVPEDPAQISNVLTSADYDKARHNPNFFEDWKGAITGGVSLIEATQKSDTFTGSVHLARAIPTEDWLPANNRTLINFTASYGKVDQPNTPEVKTDLVHFDAEQDEYFSARAYGLLQAAFDHNFSQGLDLQQTYSIGVGWSVLRSPNQTLDLKATASYISQHFTVSSSNQSLIGSIFGETYTRKLPAGIAFNEQITFIPAWNNTNAYTWNAGAGVTMTLYKRFALNVSALDTFLNDPPPGFKKNSFQFTTGVTYSLP